ncbi:TPA: hypothetical protein TXL59_000528 [Streptococcus suis]|nr:hypothetical protein [Streptococcus suis]
MSAFKKLSKENVFDRLMKWLGYFLNIKELIFSLSIIIVIGWQLTKNLQSETYQIIIIVLLVLIPLIISMYYTQHYKFFVNFSYLLGVSTKESSNIHNLVLYSLSKNFDIYTNITEDKQLKIITRKSKEELHKYFENLKLSLLALKFRRVAINLHLLTEDLMFNIQESISKDLINEVRYRHSFVNISNFSYKNDSYKDALTDNMKFCLENLKSLSWIDDSGFYHIMHPVCFDKGNSELHYFGYLETIVKETVANRYENLIYNLTIEKAYQIGYYMNSFRLALSVNWTDENDGEKFNFLKILVEKY